MRQQPLPRISVLYSALAEEGTTLAGFPQWTLDKGHPKPMKDKEKVEELVWHKALGGGPRMRGWEWARETVTTRLWLYLDRSNDGSWRRSSQKEQLKEQSAWRRQEEWLSFVITKPISRRGAGIVSNSRGGRWMQAQWKASEFGCRKNL